MGRSVVVGVSLNPAGLIAGAKAGAAAIKDFGSEFDKAAEKGGKGFDELAAGAAVAGGAILLGFGLAVNKAMEFDKAMSHVGAAANATGKDLAALRQSALDAGAATAFSAKEAAQGQEELVKAGVSVKDVLGGGLKGALDLAAAGTLEVAEAAEIAATAMVQFKLKGSDVPHIADLLSAGANKAQGSVHDLGMALKMGGLVASQYGLSVEETTGTLAAFASAGLLGSDAGTSLKTALLMLGNPTEKSANLMKELGISAFDASGNFVGMAGLAGQLREKLAHLTQEQRNAALAQIFGADAVRGAAVLYEQGAEGISKWTSAVDDSGNASRTAAAKMDNLAGDLERLKGALDTALIQTGSQSTGVLRVLTQAGEGMLEAFIGMPGPMQSVVTILGLLVGGALAAAGAYGVMAPKVAQASASLVSMGAAGRMANAAMIGLGKGVGIAFLALAGMQIASAAMATKSRAAATSVDLLTTALRDFGKSGEVSGELAQLMGKNVDQLNSDLLTLDRSGLQGATNSFGRFAESLTGAGDMGESTMKRASERIGAIDQALANLVKSGHTEEAKAAFDELAKRGEDLGPAMSTSVNELKAGLPEYSKAVREAGSASTEAGAGMEVGAQQAKTLAGGMAAAVKEAGSLADALSGLNDVNMSAFEAGNQYQIGLNGMTAALRENKGAWFGASTAAVENRQIVGDQIKTAQDFLGKQHAQTTATRGQAAADAEATKAHGTMRTAMINAAVAAGINRGAVTALIDQLFRVPKDTKAPVSAPGARASTGEVANLRGQINALSGKSVRVNAQVAGEAAVRNLNNAIARLHNRELFITTHHRTVGSIGRESLGMGGFRHGGINIHPAASGLVHATTAPPGTMFQWAEPETGGEAFIPRRGNRQRSKAILETAAGWYGMGLVPMADGGLAAAAREVLDRLNSKTNNSLFEDLTYRGMSSNLRTHNDALWNGISPYLGKNWDFNASEATRTSLTRALSSYLAAGNRSASAPSFAGAAIGSRAAAPSAGATQVMQPVQLVVDGRVLAEAFIRYEHSNGASWRGVR